MRGKSQRKASWSRLETVVPRLNTVLTAAGATAVVACLPLAEAAEAVAAAVVDAGATAHCA